MAVNEFEAGYLKECLNTFNNCKKNIDRALNMITLKEA